MVSIYSMFVVMCGAACRLRNYHGLVTNKFKQLSLEVSVSCVLILDLLV